MSRYRYCSASGSAITWSGNWFTPSPIEALNSERRAADGPKRGSSHRRAASSSGPAPRRRAGCSLPLHLTKTSMTANHRMMRTETEIRLMVKRSDRTAQGHATTNRGTTDHPTTSRTTVDHRATDSYHPLTRAALSQRIRHWSDASRGIRQPADAHSTRRSQAPPFADCPKNDSPISRKSFPHRRISSDSVE